MTNIGRNRKVLIITYYWPPAGGVAVQRWLKFAKYLPEFGWEPIVYIPENPAYPLIDNNLISQVNPNVEVISRPIFEPRKLLEQWMKFGRQKKSVKARKIDHIFQTPKTNQTWVQKILIWGRSNFLIPDARVTWVKPSIKHLSDYLHNHPVDIIVSSGPPQSLHLIAMALNKIFNIKWIADFRDPWTDIQFYDKLSLTKYADSRHRKLEKAVIRSADLVTVVAPYWKKKYTELGAKRCEVLTNGYDQVDFEQGKPQLSEKFVLTHAGTLSNDRNCIMLWEALSELSLEWPEFRKDLVLQVLGNISSDVEKELQKHDIDKNIVNHGFVSHSEAIMKMQESQLLLLLINDVSYNAPGRMTSKIFEYLAAKRPILFIGMKESDPADIIKDRNAGFVVAFNDKESLKKTLINAWRLYKQGGLSVHTDIKQYSRKNLTKTLTIKLSSLIKNNSM